MTLATKSISGHVYSFERLNAFDQFNVVRKLSGALIILSTPMRREKDEKPPSAEEFASLLVASTAALNNADMDYVNRICLSSVRRKQDSGTMAAVMEPRTGQLMFDDIGLTEMSQLLWGVMEAHRFLDFFSAPSSISEDQKPKTS